jgi:hypothetical protein
MISKRLIVKAFQTCAVLLFIFGFYPAASSAETASTNESVCYWVDAGMGWSSEDLYPGIAFHFLHGHHLFSLYGDYSDEVEVLFADNVEEWLLDIGVTYGYCRKRRITGLSASVGLSFIRGVRPGDYIGSDGGWFSGGFYEEILYTTVGIPVSLRAFITPTGFLGFGVEGYANINAAHSLIGAQVILMFGKVR